VTFYLYGYHNDVYRERNLTKMPSNPDSLELVTLQTESQVSLLSSAQPEDTASSTNAQRFGRIKDLSKWLPDIDPSTDTRWSTRLTNRDVKLLLILGLSILILALNLGITIWAAVKHGIKDNISDVIGTGSGADCAMVKDWNRWLHFGINVSSTLLLGASNYCAQLLLAPTRKQVDEAHKKKMWLDIGIQSFRNLKKAPVQQQALWILLMLSSGLLHLL
jgi:hypothetical protein